MKANGIRSKVIKKYKATTNSKHNLPVAYNILNQNFKADKPNEKWVSDITYIPTREGWLYLNSPVHVSINDIVSPAQSTSTSSPALCSLCIEILLFTLKLRNDEEAGNAESKRNFKIET